MKTRLRRHLREIGAAVLLLFALWLAAGLQLHRRQSNRALARGADVGARSGLGGTPLHQALDPEIVRLLLAHGAQVDARDNMGRTPLFSIANGGTARNLRLRLLLAAGADPNARDRFEETPPQFSEVCRATPCAELLLAAGANPDGWQSAQITRPGAARKPGCANRRRAHNACVAATLSEPAR